MTEEEKKTWNKEMFSVLAILFFPYITNFMLKTPDAYELEEEDIAFIKHFEKKGWMIIWAAGFLFGTFLVTLFFKFSFREITNTILWIAFLGLVWYVIYNIFIIFNKEELAVNKTEKIDSFKLNFTQIQSGNTLYIFSYIPVFNYFIYSGLADDDNRRYWMKESVVFRYVMTFLAIFALYSDTLAFAFYVWLLFIIFRAVALFGGIDIISEKIKEKIYWLFDVNPDEMLAYPLWLLSYILQEFIAVVKWKDSKKRLWEHIESFKRTLQNSSNIESFKSNKHLVAQYVIGLILYGGLVWVAYKAYSIDSMLYILGVIFIATKYGLDVYQQKIYMIPVIWHLYNVWKRLIRKKNKKKIVFKN